jgi:hypothetical protein
MRSANETDTPEHLPRPAWLAVLVLSAAILTYETFMVLKPRGLALAGRDS